MSMVQGTQSGTPAADLSALLQLAATQQGSTKALDVKDLEESLNALRSFLAAGGDSLLPDLEEPSSKSSTTVSLSGLTMSGLSLETLLDAVGFEQRRTETKAGMASLEARAQERAMANDEKLKSIQEQLEKAKSQSFLDGLLKAFKYIGMALAAIGSVAMIAAGAVGLAAGGSGAAHRRRRREPGAADQLHHGGGLGRQGRLQSGIHHRQDHGGVRRQRYGDPVDEVRRGSRHHHRPGGVHVRCRGGRRGR